MRRKTSHFLTSFLILAFLVSVHAQNRGNILSFQGVDKALTFTPGALGSGLDGISDLGGSASIFSNPAGLSGIKGLTVSTGMVSIENQWWENQHYRPNRLFVTLPFYLEGLYIPDPINNGRLDSDVFFESLLDTSYLVSNPEMGLEHFSEEAADWKQTESTSGLSHFGIALPVNIAGNKIAFSAGYASLLNGISYDRNKTYLTPHPGYIDYNMPALVEGADTTRIDWYDFQRLQKTNLNQISLGVGYEATENIHLGLGLSIYSGGSEELQVQDKVGYFDLIDQNEFIWSYDTMNTQYSGDADFSGTAIKLGLILDYDHFRMGLSYTSKMDLTKDWSYEKTLTYLQGDTLLTSSMSTIEGQDVMTIPGSYGVGVQLKPVEKFTFLLSYEMHLYGDSEVSRDTLSTFSMGDMQSWIDQSIVQFGMRYELHDMVYLNALYRSVPMSYVPDGAAIKASGPEAISYRLGVELDLGSLGGIDLGYALQDLKYQDNYYSNTNYSREQGSSFTVSYIYSIK
ncbi:MAG: outer membrane protein transport protein [Candidatus Marinimicrobia bacterium]|nr:outer membrane protein transport protein [Candidatus Neomarinimicrobiota bacterium]